MTTLYQNHNIIHYNQSGFSLIELMITLSILSVIASIAIPSFKLTSANQGIKNSSSIIANVISEAKSESFLHKNEVRIAYNSINNTLTLSSPDPSSTNFQNPPFEAIATYQLNSNIVVNITPNALKNIAIINGERLESLNGNPISEIKYTLCDKRTTDAKPRQVAVTSKLRVTTSNLGSCE